VVKIKIPILPCCLIPPKHQTAVRHPSPQPQSDYPIHRSPITTTEPQIHHPKETPPTSKKKKKKKKTNRKKEKETSPKRKKEKKKPKTARRQAS
jgi:hypothetical protein